MRRSKIWLSAQTNTGGNVEHLAAAEIIENSRAVAMQRVENGITIEPGISSKENMAA